MIKTTLEGLTLLPSPPKAEGPFIEPVVRLEDGLVLDSRVFEVPTLVVGNQASGKTVLTFKIAVSIFEYAARVGDNVVIFCPKKDYLRYARPGDIIISPDSKDPASCWNIFLDMKASGDPERTAREIIANLTKDQKSSQQPFFVNATNDFLFNSLMDMYEDGEKRGITYTNWHFKDFLEKTSIKPVGDNMTWNDLAKIRPERFAHLDDYLGDKLGQGYGIVSEIRTLLHECFWGSFASPEGRFSAIETLRKGSKRIFLCYDFSTCSESTIKNYSTIVDLLFKNAVSEENKRRTWFFLDEGSLLPKTCLCDAMSLGREAGIRVIICLQSAQLLTRHYSKQEASNLLSIMPNVICLKVNDAFTRNAIADRYGKSLVSYSFTDAMGKTVHHAEWRPVIADSDFAKIIRKGDAICSIPNLCTSPFIYHGYKEGMK